MRSVTFTEIITVNIPNDFKGSVEDLTLNIPLERITVGDLQTQWIIDGCEVTGSYTSEVEEDQYEEHNSDELLYCRWYYGFPFFP